MANKLKRVAVYCGHQFGTNPAYAIAAENVGEMLAKNDIDMVFGGGNVGLMGAVASSALAHGAHVTGVSTHDVMSLQEPLHNGVDVIVVDGVNDRKQKMYELSDAFIILPGGIGTLNELTDIMTMQQIGETVKPLFFLNTDGYWAPFGELFAHMQHHGFTVSMDAYNIHIANTVDELTEMLLNY